MFVICKFKIPNLAETNTNLAENHKFNWIPRNLQSLLFTTHVFPYSQYAYTSVSPLQCGRMLPGLLVWSLLQSSDRTLEKLKDRTLCKLKDGTLCKLKDGTLCKLKGKTLCKRRDSTWHRLQYMTLQWADSVKITTVFNRTGVAGAVLHTAS